MKSANIIVSTLPVQGHVNQVLPIVKKLVERGHKVRWHTGSGFRDKVLATGATHLPPTKALDFDPANIEAFAAHWQKYGRATGLQEVKNDFKTLFLDTMIGQYQDLLEASQQDRPDVVLCESTSLGPSLLQEKTGIPWVSQSTSVLNLPDPSVPPFNSGLPLAKNALERAQNQIATTVFQRFIMRDVNIYANQLRASIGLPPWKDFFLSHTLSPFLHLQGTIPEFEYPYKNLPSHVHFIGPVLPEVPKHFEPPSWWSELNGELPVVHVTQGTVATNAADLLKPTLQALANENLLVVATTGGKPLETLGTLPKNVRAAPFIPHPVLLPLVDVMITNAGYSGTQTALANGVPMVAAGDSEEKPEVCARIEYAGVGINLKTGKPTPEQIREAVKRILGTPGYKARAKELAEKCKGYNAPELAATLIEKLLAEKS